VIATDTARCGKCKRPLRRPSPDGYGPRCRARLRAAQAVMEQALEGLSERQKDKALALISSVSVVLTSRPGTYSVPGSDTKVVYITTTASCTCPARVICKHMGAVRAIEAVRAASTRRAA